MLSLVVSDIGCGGLMSLNVRPLPACVIASKAVVFLLDNCPSLFLPGVTRVPEPHFCSVVVQSFIIVLIKNVIWPDVLPLSLAGSRAGWGAAVYWPSHWRNPQCGLEKRRQIQSGTERCSTVSAQNKLEVVTFIFESVHSSSSFLSSIEGSWSITERRPSHDEAPHPLVPNKASHLPAVKYLSVRLLLHPMALTETTDDRGACHYQGAWTICRESRAFTR